MPANLVLIGRSLRSKRFRLFSEHRKTGEEQDFRFLPWEKWNESQFSRGV